MSEEGGWNRFGDWVGGKSAYQSKVLGAGGGGKDYLSTALGWP